MQSLVMRHFNDDVLDDKVSESWIGYRHFIAGVMSPDEGQFWDCFYPAAHRFQDGWQ
ncbi:hypothetical protein DAEQUDRAFT_721051 [Daedalea quercina L-15889]|uniref:Uncharacterized protein n=1 Tax=Daedalea quercina L-15889 TaxID=1314783 RepID=A0A165TZ47_9APHY|nr:hypothetical protein DAEQUDRAFT_721051 [Daedalea quercina L-15889]